MGEVSPSLPSPHLVAHLRLAPSLRSCPLPLLLGGQPPKTPATALKKRKAKSSKEFRLRNHKIKIV